MGRILSLESCLDQLGGATWDKDIKSADISSLQLIKFFFLSPHVATLVQTGDPDPLYMVNKMVRGLFFSSWWEQPWSLRPLPLSFWKISFPTLVLLSTFKNTVARGFSHCDAIEWCTKSRTARLFFTQSLHRFNFGPFGNYTVSKQSHFNLIQTFGRDFDCYLFPHLLSLISNCPFFIPCNTYLISCGHPYNCPSHVTTHFSYSSN